MSRGDYIFSTVHKRVVPCPSTMRGASGSLRSDWDGSTSVLDNLKSNHDQELDTLLSFEKTRSNKYQDFSGKGERIRGGRSKLTKIFGRVASGGRSQKYREHIVDYLQEKKQTHNKSTVKVERDFRKKLDQIRVRRETETAQKRRKKFQKLVRRVSNGATAVRAMQDSVLKSKGKSKSGRKRANFIAAQLVESSQKAADDANANSGDNDRDGAQGVVGKNGSRATTAQRRKSARSRPDSSRSQSQRRPKKVPNNIKDFIRERARSAPHPAPKPQGSTML